jgi:hypothetical protein
VAGITVAGALINLSPGGFRNVSESLEIPPNATPKMPNTIKALHRLKKSFFNFNLNSMENGIKLNRALRP